ncbi:MAG: hypothetical protein K2P86_07970 [Xanthobacteraceae bacterium]|jgi:hypothetical protein|nr:hypothetical protein [Xanthobacteraceae bacterium]
MRVVFAALIAFSFMPALTATDASAQATCRSKCTEEEQMCLKRTNNKGQCGDKAKQCASKCK